MANFDFLAGIGSGLTNLGQGLRSVDALGRAEKLEQERKDRILRDEQFRTESLAQTASIADTRETGLGERTDAVIAARASESEESQFAQARRDEIVRDTDQITAMRRMLQDQGINVTSPDILRGMASLSPSVPLEEGADPFDSQAFLGKFKEGRSAAEESGDIFVGEGFFASPPKISRSETTSFLGGQGRPTAPDRSGEANEFLKRLQTAVSSQVNQTLASLRIEFEGLPQEQLDQLRKQASESYVRQFGGVQGFQLDPQGNLFDSQTGQTIPIIFDEIETGGQSGSLLEELDRLGGRR